MACGASAVQGVAAILDTPDEHLRLQAAWILGHLDAPGALAPLLHALERGGPMARLESAVALARIGSRTDGRDGEFVRALTRIRTGEIEPHYVMW